MGSCPLDVSFWYISSNTGDCDHLELYPVYSEMDHLNINLTSWDKPWIPELDWLNSYINLSIYEDEYLYGLANGYRVTKYAKYYWSSKYGCIMRFPWDAELADDYYFENYANTSQPMLLCSPYVPMKPGSFRDWAKRYDYDYGMLTCWGVVSGYLKEVYQEGDLSFIWNTYGGTTLRVALVVAVLITITGVLGK